MTPVLYTFRRCPYAMRARLALQVSGVETELREIVLRQKPQAFLDASPSATVPCLVTERAVIDESLDVMIWALQQNDPQGWLNMPEEGNQWITRCDGPFKHALDRTKYATRYPNEAPEEHRAIAAQFLSDLEAQINTWLFDKPTLADFAILPFIRQFAFIDKPWFDAQPWPRVHNWLENFVNSDHFNNVMGKYDPWSEGDPPIYFPDPIPLHPPAHATG